jgi:RND family efflux transporter MFP subunit
MRRSLRLATWIALAVALCFIVFATVRFLRRPPAVEVAEVVRQDVVRSLAITGRIAPLFVNAVTPLQGGRLAEMMKDEGDSVRLGETLARLRDSEQTARVEQARAAIAARREQWKSDEREMQRNGDLFHRGLVPHRDYEQDSLKVEQGRAALRQLDEMLQEVRARLEDYVVRAPYSGIVLERPVDPGQEVSTQTVLFRIASGGTPRVETDVDEQFLGELRLGMPATVVPLDGTNRTLAAHLEFIGSEVVSESGAARVRFAFDTPPPPFPAGLSMDVNVVVARHPGAVVVPRMAVVDPARNSWVLVAAGARTERRPVTVINWQAPELVVTDGLEPGQRVVLSPRRIAPGIAIRPKVSPVAIRTEGGRSLLEE